LRKGTSAKTESAKQEKKVLHLAQIGIGRVGRPTAYTIMSAGLVDTLTVCDVKSGLALAFAEELKHAAASCNFDVEIVSCDDAEQVSGADLILISAGEPRTPGVKMTRRDLAVQNARIVKAVSEATVSRNPGAKYVVISNPVDSMAMVCKKYSKADFVISTGTNLESLRFRSKLAECLGVPVFQVSGWVGGEHGDAAIPLWSTVKVGSAPVDSYAESQKKSFSKEEIAAYVKSVSKLIVDNIGGTEFGPAASFRDIARAIVRDTKEVLSVAAPMTFAGLSETPFVGVPRLVGRSLGATFFDGLSAEEKGGLFEAARAISQTYLLAVENLEES
jgi:malate dehydrogenase